MHTHRKSYVYIYISHLVRHQPADVLAYVATPVLWERVSGNLYMDRGKYCHSLCHVPPDRSIELALDNLGGV